jgi:hypothetical protein
VTDEHDRVPLDAAALFEVLERHRVAYVVVGGYAAELHGSVRRTVDVDVVPRTTLDNLERLTQALRELRARIRTDDDAAGLPFATSAEVLAGMSMLNLVTAHGELDLNFTPTGTAGYEDLHTDATTFIVGRVQTARCQSLAGGCGDCTVPAYPSLLVEDEDVPSLVELRWRSGLNLTRRL